MMLKIKDLQVHYDKALAVDRASLEVESGKIVALIGANGAGKTTILNVLSGLKAPTSGEIWFLGRKIGGMKAYDIVNFGLVHIPEGRRLFPNLTVLENLKLGASTRRDSVTIRNDMERVFEYFPVLRERYDQKAGSMSGGEQQMLAISRGLMAKPKLLLMDEPSLGLAPLVVDEVARITKIINESGVSVLLAEQNVSLAFQVASEGYILQVGRIILHEKMEELRSSEIVKQAYLGE